jgi:hypothetical protein
MFASCGFTLPCCAAPAAVKQTCVFLTPALMRVLNRFPLPFEVKELGKEIKLRILHAVTGLLTLAA